ncbi:ankyrin repeat protein [Hokovirus HKV1]|uniref:NAD(+)--protein-arginine ADP-ribosyltransferase n=1 Tax=Hokovirus HKV1 TaxID=1977638 RepID=A0A1V0SEL4_9VIRU|nr:ankyrin repeat protein [Hokovirus HKV1]
MNENLICPITLTLLQDPINLPCCGNVISRLPLKEYFNTLPNSKCPLCRKNLDNFNVDLAPKVVNIASMIDILNQNDKQNDKQNDNKNNNLPKDSLNFTGKLYPIKENSYKTRIGKLEIKCDNVLFKTLIIPVIDISGSMSGNPLTQAKYSLNRIIDLTYQNLSNITNIVTYNDNYNIIDINTSSAEIHYKTIINNLVATGGTSFTSAFKGICSVIDKHKDEQEISNIVIVFLTDGEDSRLRGDKRLDLVNQLKADLIKNKPITIHTIGFGSHHDFNFLNSLRLSCLEGCYKYADPTEDLDNLSNKINSIIDVIMNNNYIPLEITSNINIIHDCQDNTFFVNITNTNLTNVNIKINDKIINVLIDLQDENNEIVKSSWHGYLIDQITRELLEITSIDNLENKIHIELLEKRCKAIIIRTDLINMQRLEKLLAMIKNIKKNIKVDNLKLFDMASEGKFSTSNTKNGIPASKATDNYHYTPIKIDNAKNNLNNGKIEYLDKHKLFTDIFAYFKNSNLLLNNLTAMKEIDLVTDQILLQETLIFCASIGRVNLVNHILEKNICDFNYKNSFGYSAIDYSIIRGFWITSNILFNNNYKPQIDPTLLFKTCINYKYFKTGLFLLDNNIATCNQKLLNYKLDSLQVEFINNNVNNIDLETVIFKGLFNKVLKFDTIISWSLFPIYNLTDNHYKIIEHLINTKQLDPNENYLNNDTITWPLFVACEKGNMQLYNILINYCDNLNKQNDKGTTILWIASCNKHVDIVLDLLEKGADPNVCNFKGDSPLIATIQKGCKIIVELLLGYGANLGLNNKNRDNCVLIACRNGQDEILDTLLTSMDIETKNTFLTVSAEIDGFYPLLAATELNRISCIKVLIKHNANIEIKTDHDNKIIVGATSLHLASFYGRLEALICLIELGCDLYATTDIDGYNALHIAIKQGHNAVARYLFKYEKLLQMKDNFNRLPSYYANSLGNEDILEFFNDPLANSLTTFINSVSNQELINKCIDKFINNSQSLTCFEYQDLLDTNIGIDKFSTYSVLTNNKKLFDFVDSVKSNNLLLNSDNNNDNNNNSDNNNSDNNNDNNDDDYEFWKCLVLQKSSSNEKVNEELSRVKQVEKQVQNKILLNLKNTNKYIMESTNQLDQNSKMNNGFDFDISKNNLGTLKNVSLLGFFDKVNDKISLEYLLTESKINAIKKIKEGSNLLPLQLICLYLYTGHYEIHNQVNLALANWQPKNIYCGFAEYLYQTIKLLDIYQGEVYRAINIPYDSKYDINNVITWNTFSICSYNWNAANNQINLKKGMIFIIKNKTGRLLSPYSKYETDSEVVFLPGSQFKVSNHYKSSIHCLGQANIRNSTYKIDDTYYNKVNNELDAIIIELEEL